MEQLTRWLPGDLVLLIISTHDQTLFTKYCYQDWDMERVDGASEGPLPVVNINAAVPSDISQ